MPIDTYVSRNVFNGTRKLSKAHKNRLIAIAMRRIEMRRAGLLEDKDGFDPSDDGSIPSPAATD